MLPEYLTSAIHRGSALLSLVTIAVAGISSVRMQLAAAGTQNVML